GSNLLHHPHLHCVVPGGGLSADGTHWISCKPGFFLPVRVLSRLFRRLFLEYLQNAFDAASRMSSSSRWQTAILCRLGKTPRLRRIWPLPGASPKSRMGGICQATFCWPSAGARLRRTLHPPCRDLEPSPAGYRRWPGAFPVERLPTSRSTENHDAFRRGVHPPFSPSCSARWIPAHSLLRLARQPPPPSATTHSPPTSAQSPCTLD